MIHRLTFTAAHVCAFCAGARFGQVLKLCEVRVQVDGDQVVLAQYWVCEACVNDNEKGIGGTLLRRTLFKWRDTLGLGMQGRDKG